MINIIDLFAGAGGLSEGFRLKPYKILCHIEMNEHACNTLKTREVFYYLKNNNLTNHYNKYIKKQISRDDLYRLAPSDLLDKVINEKISDDTIDDILAKLETLIGDEVVHGIVGGPPCQAFSMIGRASNRFKKDKDERIYLYEYYVEFLHKFRPLFFVFENVKGLLSFRNHNNEYLFPIILEKFKSIGYRIDYKVLNSSDFGVSQNRERIFIFGYRNDIQPIDFFEKLARYKETAITIKELFDDLPMMRSGEDVNRYLRKRPNKFVSNYYRKNKLPLSQNITRTQNERDLKIYKIVAEKKQKGVQVKYNELPDNLRSHNDISNFLDRFKALKADDYSHTMVAHIAKDGHYYIHYDVNQNRSISVRESARIQGFPDDYYFEGNRSNMYMQIGNAVPPLVSLKIARAISDSLETDNDNMNSVMKY